MAKKRAVTVYIDNDVGGLGPDATQDDLDGYAQNLANHLAQRFSGLDITVTQRLGGGPMGNNCPDDDQIAEYVTDLESGLGWEELLP